MRNLAALIGIIAILFGFTHPTSGQTVSTGALKGVTLDPSGAVLPDARLLLINKKTGDTRDIASDSDGRFTFALLPPGNYDIQASKTNFELAALRNLTIHVTETLEVKLQLPLAGRVDLAEVLSSVPLAQTEASALGRVVDNNTIINLPLVSRNFTQIAGLSPGVLVGISNAGELGLGGSALSPLGKSNDGIYVHGARSYDNNWQMDGISVSDVMSSGSSSGGIPTPNPGTLEEFKVQTALYDAAFGRGAGANISVITKRGGNDFHGTIFEFLRNNVLNANDFFLKEAGQQRPDLKQNQFGFTLGGPIKKNKSLFFGSYQGTRQITGLATGQARIACSASLSEPPIGNDRSPAGLGKLFGGMKGVLGGIAVRPDGSNINPVALSLLNFRLSDNSYLIPTPQTIDPSKPFASQGFSVFTKPCSFDEDQFLFNVDHTLSPQSQIAARFFTSHSAETVGFPGGAVNPAGNTPGFASPAGSNFVVFSLAHTYSRSSTSLNEARLGFVRTRTATQAKAPFKWSDVGVAEGSMNRANQLPSLNILGSLSMTPGFPRTYTQNSFVFNDVLSLLKGAHSMRFGGSLTRLQDNLGFAGTGSFVQFLSWPDFLLGLDGTGNGTGSFSNVYSSVDVFGRMNRELRAWEGSVFATDDYRISKSLTLNVGVRYERLGQFGDKLGRSSSFDFSKADRNPPPGGSLDGYIVAANFTGELPPGVMRAGNTFGTYGKGQNTVGPRVGFAWQILPRLTLRGGYGIYRSRPTGQAFTQSIIAAPFGLARMRTGMSNASATFQAPFAQPFPIPSSFPFFTPYSSSSMLSVSALAADFIPAVVQQFSLNTQVQILPDWLLEVGYAGTRGTHLQRLRSLNQALDASGNSPVHGVTLNTVANIPFRTPLPGIPADSLREMESDGLSWYNGLEVSLTKRWRRGLQFLGSYTFSKTLDSDGSEINGISAGNTLTLGDQNSSEQRWGRASFDRTHRFVLSGTWALPNPREGLRRAFLGSWNLSGVATIQSGTALTIGYTNANNVFGISQDRAQLALNCSTQQLVRAGPVDSKLNKYFNTSCLTTPPVIGADGIGTAFGNSGTGIVSGPGQENLDVALSKAAALPWPRENSKLQFRLEFFNAFNHEQFANPDTNLSSPTFGVINSTAVTPRVGQLALRLVF
jgi:hypothetical protein